MHHANQASLLALEQAWPTRGSRAACGSLADFMRLLRGFHMTSVKNVWRWRCHSFPMYRIFTTIWRDAHFGENLRLLSAPYSRENTVAS